MTEMLDRDLILSAVDVSVVTIQEHVIRVTFRRGECFRYDV
jgi:hypothetical protein